MRRPHGRALRTGAKIPEPTANKLRPYVDQLIANGLRFPLTLVVLSVSGALASFRVTTRDDMRDLGAYIPPGLSDADVFALPISYIGSDGESMTQIDVTGAPGNGGNVI